MCFGPQRRAMFRHLNFKKWPELAGSLTFWFANALLATAGCHFSICEVQKVVRSCGVLCILTCKCVFSPKRRAIFWHRNFQNCSGTEVFCTSWLENVLRATAACLFLDLCWTPTSAPAALPSLLFEHPEPRIIEKTQRFGTFLTFRACVPSL